MNSFFSQKTYKLFLGNIKLFLFFCLVGKNEICSPPCHQVRTNEYFIFYCGRNGKTDCGGGTGM